MMQVIDLLCRTIKRSKWHCSCMMPICIYQKYLSNENHKSLIDVKQWLPGVTIIHHSHITSNLQLHNQFDAKRSEKMVNSINISHVLVQIGEWLPHACERTCRNNYVPRPDRPQALDYRCQAHSGLDTCYPGWFQD